MPTEAVLNQLSSRKVTESLMMQIILHCAPVLKDVKMSSMFTVPAAYLRFVRSAFRGTGSGSKCLCQEQDVQWYMYTGKQKCSSVWKIRRWLYFYSSYGYESTTGRSMSESSWGTRFPVGPGDGALSP